MKLRFLSKLKQFRWSKLLLIWLVFLLIAGVLFAERCGIKYAYLFWSITTGITAGAGMYALGLVTAVVMIGMILFFYHWQAKGRVYIAVIHYLGTDAEDDIVRAFGRCKFVVKSKTMRKDSTEMAVEVFSKDPNLEFTDRLRAVNGVQDVTLIQYNGEYHG